MPSLEYHLARDRDLLGEEFPEVHRILDQFAHYPDMRFLQEHRKFLHHAEGIDYITLRFGEVAGHAARVHVRDDCGHVPTMEEYALGIVDNFGGKKYA
jgi:hypothetical protein